MTSMISMMLEPGQVRGPNFSENLSGFQCYTTHTHSLPSGKRLHNYGKSQFSMGKFTINGDFPYVVMLVYQRVFMFL